MQRLRLYDFRTSRGPADLGICSTDIPEVCSYVNSAQQRLLFAKEAADEGWYGTWSEMAFNIDQEFPFITLPRGAARIEAVTACRLPIAINNQFYEYMDFGDGRLPGLCSDQKWSPMQGFMRNNCVTFGNVGTWPIILRVELSDARDIGKRVLVQGTDSNDQVIYSQDGNVQVEGIFVNLDTPFVDCPTQLNSLTGLQKDITYGNVNFYQVDPNTGTATLLHFMEPGEETAWYRRYYFDQTPRNCCCGSTATDTSTTVQMTALVKLDLVPVRVDTDYLLIQNIEALILECQAIKYDRMESAGASLKSKEKHRDAIRLLIGQMTHYFGQDSPAVNFKPFGSAHLWKLNLGMK